MSALRSRHFQPGDETELNALYNRMVGTRGLAPARSLQLFRWLWYHAPGGPIASWVVESEQSDGSWKIVGHHALFPVRFTLGEEDLLCAKTANSFLLPEFRSKFLYLRFEKDCLAEADSRFDATYSCARGVTRIRKPLGYAGDARWIRMVRGLQSPSALSRLAGVLANRYPGPAWGHMAHMLAAVSERDDRSLPLKLLELSSGEAMRSAFFSQFWREARMCAGMSPRRDPADLTWRFWQRPGTTYATLIHESCGSCGYCIVNTSNPCSFFLEDIFVLPLRAGLLEALLAALFQWCARRGALLLTFCTASDGQPPEFMETFARYMRPHPLQRFRPPKEMPRRVSPHVKAKLGIAVPCWNATSLLAPG